MTAERHNRAERRRLAKRKAEDALAPSAAVAQANAAVAGLYEAAAAEAEAAGNHGIAGNLYEAAAAARKRESDGATDAESVYAAAELYRRAANAHLAANIGAEPPGIEAPAHAAAAELYAAAAEPYAATAGRQRKDSVIVCYVASRLYALEARAYVAQAESEFLPEAIAEADEAAAVA